MLSAYVQTCPATVASLVRCLVGVAAVACMFELCSNVLGKEVLQMNDDSHSPKKHPEL
jgi:hypothetical protein